MKSAIFESDLELEEAIGDVEAPGGLWTEGESVVEAFYRGETSVLNRLGGAMISSVTMNGLTAEPVMDFNIELDAKVKAGTIKNECLVDKWTGKLYGLVTLGDIQELYYVSDWRINVQTFNTTNDKDEVVLSYNLAVYDELKDGVWVPDNDTNEGVMKAAFIHHAKEHDDFKGAFDG